MSLSPAILDAMVATGCTPEQIAAVVKASMAEEDAKAEAQKEKARERKRRQRSREADDCHAVSHDVTVTERDIDGPLPPSSSSPSPPNDIYSNPPSPSPSSTPTRKKTGARKAHRLPENWQPGALTESVSEIVSQWPCAAIDRELEKFRDWAAQASGSNSTKKDWDAAWRNWLRNADERMQKGQDHYGKQQPSNQRTAELAEQLVSQLPLE